jgi:hypothetical protein
MKTYTGDIEKVGYYSGYKGRQSWVCHSSEEQHLRNLSLSFRKSTRIITFLTRSSSTEVCVMIARVICEFYPQVVHRDVTKIPHPQAVRPFLPELDAFARHNHFQVLHPILRSVRCESLVDVFLPYNNLMQLDCVKPRVA